MQLQEITDQAQWDEYVQSHPYGHPLQLWGWGELKRLNGWTPHRLAIVSAGKIVAAAQVLMWPIPKLSKMVAYVPRGPVGEPNTAATKKLLQEMVEFARNHKALYVHVEPSWAQNSLPNGWKRSHQQILLAKTYTIDLTKPEQQLLAAMRGKTRQYIRKAETMGVTISQGGAEDLDDFWSIYQHTAKRAGFGLHKFSYYQQLLRLFGDSNRIYFAYVDNRPVAFLWVADAAGVAFELYGGVGELGAEMKANYMLKWHAIMDAHKRGNRIYDFNGRLNDGVSQFKTGFGPDETEYGGPWDWAVGRVGYAVWNKLLPALKPIGRRVLKRGKK